MADEKVKPKLIENEMMENYIDYAMSVIMQRALPDVKDGLKPVHRRILYTMHNMDLHHDKPFVKSARIVGECFKYHPHGDASIYDSLVRMAQDFSLRYPLVKGHGNFGSILDGFKQAHMKYTEAKLGKIGEELLVDIEKNTVDFTPNFDGSFKEPTVLPARLPNLLINGSSGIAVGMATNTPPHNIKEVIDGAIFFINNPNISIQELIKTIKGPDFPTAGFICGRQGIIDAYTKGRGKITLKAKTHFENNTIIVTEIPYQINKATLIEHIAELVKNKKIDGISELRDESDKRGIRVVIGLKRDVNPQLVLNQLLKQTALQTTFGIIMLALVNNEPRILNLKDIIKHYVGHRKDVVTRKTRFELDKAEKREHIIVGLKTAIKNIDSIVNLIKKAETPENAKTSLINNFKLSEVQAHAVLDMKLQRLTSLEKNKIEKEHTNLIELIKKLKELLSSEKNILGYIKNELTELREKYQDERRTKIIGETEELTKEDLIKEQDVVITVTHSGYIKQTLLKAYKKQKRGGTGVKTAEIKEEDIIEQLFVTSNHNTLLFFTNKGKVHWLKAYDIPLASRYSRGKAIVNLLKLGEKELVNTVLSIKEFDEKHYILFATKNGVLKKTSLIEYSNPRKSGIIAINLKENDELVQLKLTTGNQNLIIGTRNGQAVKFNEEDVRATGRNASGVIGIRLTDDEVIGMEIAKEDATLLTATEKGYGKRTKISEYRLIKRGGSGVRNIKISEKNGKAIGIKVVNDDDEIMFITERGLTIRLSAKEIPVIGRSTQGVRLMRLKEGDKVNVAAVIPKEE